MFISKEKNLFISKNKEKEKFLRFSSYGLLLFLIPIFLSHQFLVGVIVNALIIRATFDHSLKKVFVLCLLPSLAVFSTGLLFGGLTSFLLWILPFIWISNFIIAFVSKKLFIGQEKNYFLSTTLGAIAKTIFLFVSVTILFVLGLVPILFLTAFGIMQLITAESGALIIGFLKVRKSVRS